MFCSLLAPIYLYLLSTTLLQNPSQLNVTLLFCRLHPIDYRSFFSSPLLFFNPSCRPPSLPKWYFLLSLLFIFIPTSLCSSSSVFPVKTHLFLSCRCFFFSSVLSVVYHDRTICFLLSLLPCFLLCTYFFYRVCSSLIPALFVSSSSPSFLTDVIALFISSSTFIFFLLFRCFFCCIMWHFHSLYTFFCSALTTPLLSCHHFCVMSPLLLPLISSCVILRSCKQTSSTSSVHWSVWVKPRNDHVSCYSCSGPIRSPAIVTSRPHCVGQDNGTLSFALNTVPRGRKFKYCGSRSAKVTFISCGNLNLGTFKPNLSRQ